MPAATVDVGRTRPARPRHPPPWGVAAVDVSVSASRTSLEELRARFVPLLLDTAAQILHDLGHGA